MKIITWNVNSIRSRIHLIELLSKIEKPDILALQETKVENDKFPLEVMQRLGYKYCFYVGEKQYNGVCIISKIKPIKNFSLEFVNKEARHLCIVLESNIEIHNFYVPAGGDEPDPVINTKFLHKLEYLDLMNNWFKSYRSPQDKIIVVGDLNVSPYEHDVWSSYQLRNEVSHTKIEREKLIRILDSISFIDVGRKYVPYDTKLFSWWSYRNKDWKKSNRGRRLDHIWVTDSLNKSLSNFSILVKARDFTRPSDHVPVILTLEEDII